MANDRGHWTSRAGFVLAAAGSAIGLGNLWKFPYLSWENGGGLFVLVYLICVACVGLPIMVAEMLIGRKTQRNPVGALREAVGPGWGWVGGLGVFTGFVILGYYTVVAGWSLQYFWKCLRWTFGGFVPGTASGESFEAFLGNGPLQVTLAAAFLALTAWIVYGGIGGGIERASRILMPALFGILVLLLLRALTLPGAGQALAFTFVPRPESFRPLGALEALGQAFFSLSLGMGAMITYGSYLGRRESIVRSAAMVVVLDTLIALAAAVIMFSVIFTFELADRITGSTVGMLFMTLPELFYTRLPFGQFLGPLFYVLVAFAALTSTISLLEVVVSCVIDERGVSRPAAVVGCSAATFGLSVLCALSFGAWPALADLQLFAGKRGLFAHLDHLAANWLLPCGGLAITLGAGWFMTREATASELLDEATPRWFSYGLWRFFIRYVAPLAVAAILAAVVRGKDFS